MIDLNYLKSNKSWPVKARNGNIELIFSGSFEDKRIFQENLRNFFEKLILITLWLLAILGIAALLFSAYLGGQLKTWEFLLLPSSFNLIFWVSAFTSVYLWAKYKDEKIKAKTLNLLHWNENENFFKQAKVINIYELFSPKTKTAWNNSLKQAQIRRKEQARVLNKPQGETKSNIIASDLILSLLELSEIKLVFIRLGINISDVQTLIKNYTILNPLEKQRDLEKIPFVAFTESLKLHNKTIDPLMLLCALTVTLPKKHILKAIFFNIDLSIEKLETLSSWIFNIRLLREEAKLFKKLSKFKPENEINKSLTSVPTFYLDKFSKDLTWEAKHGRLPLALGRGGDLTEIFKLFSAGRKNLIIKGTPGTGRTTLINELAFKMVTEQVPKILQDKRMVRLEISGIMGTAARAESIFISSLKEAVRAGNIVIIIEEIHSLSKIMSSSGLSFAELLVDFLQNHSLTVIGITNLEDYTDYLQNISNIGSTFISYELAPLSKEGILLACCIKSSILEYRNNCFFRFNAILQAIELTDLYLKSLGQPQKAISILVEAALRAKNSETKIVTTKLIEKIISEKTHIPSHTFSQNEAEKLLNLETTLAKFIVGQKEALKATSEGLRRARSGLASKQRPLASFMFLGPTGVGKTEVARVLAREYFGENKFLLRLDMSEYQGAGGLAKLLGKPENKFDAPLIKHVKNYPFCLLLLDEFEKAGSGILNLFLQILEDGRITSAKGETIDLTHCLIIATSNAGTKEIQEGIKQNLNLEQIKQKLFNLTLTKIFPPELLNRFDGIIVFNPLTADEVQKITYLQLEILKKQMLDKGVKLEFSQNVIKEIAKRAFNPLLGARPIRRYIQDHVEGFIAKLLLARQLPRGSNITIDLKNGEPLIKHN